MGTKTSFSHVLGVILLLGISSLSSSVHSTFIPLKPGTTFVNNDLLNGRVKSGDITRYIITDETSDFALGFFNVGPASSAVAPGSRYYLAIVTKPTGDPTLWNLVWAANRGTPVHENAKLFLDGSGNLRLDDADGTNVWSSGSGKYNTGGLSLDSTGNLKLLYSAGNTLWQSFDSPTDSLLPGQALTSGNSLVSSKSLYHASKGLDYSAGSYKASALPGGLALFNGNNAAYYIQSAETQLHTLASVQKTCKYLNDLIFVSARGLVVSTDVTKSAPPSQVDPSLCGKGDGSNSTIVIPSVDASTQRFARIDPDGSLAVYQYNINSRAFVKNGSVGK